MEKINKQIFRYEKYGIQNVRNSFFLFHIIFGSRDTVANNSFLFTLQAIVRRSFNRSVCSLCRKCCKMPATDFCIQFFSFFRKLFFEIHIKFLIYFVLFCSILWAKNIYGRCSRCTLCTVHDGTTYTILANEKNGSKLVEVVGVATGIYCGLSLLCDMCCHCWRSISIFIVRSECFLCGSVCSVKFAAIEHTSHIVFDFAKILNSTAVESSCRKTCALRVYENNEEKNIRLPELLWEFNSNMIT